MAQKMELSFHPTFYHEWTLHFPGGRHLPSDRLENPTSFPKIPPREEHVKKNPIIAVGK